MSVLQRQEAEIPLNGGQDDTSGAEYQAVTTMRAVTDLRWSNGGEFEKRPATASTQEITDPSNGVYAGLQGDSIIESRGEPYLMTRNFGLMNSRGRYIGQKGQPVGWTLGYADGLTPLAARVGRLFVDRTSASNHEQGIWAAASCVYNSTTLVTACIVRLASGSGMTLRLQAVDIDTGSIVAQAQYDGVNSGGSYWAVDACPNSDATTPGAVITFAIGTGAPYSIFKYRYRAGTLDFVYDGAIVTDAVFVRHRIVQSPTADGRFLIAYEAVGNFLYARDATCTANTPITTHTGTHSAYGGVDIVVSGSKIMIVSCDRITASAVVYTERFGTPATALAAHTTSAAETVLSVTAARETSNASDDRAVVFIAVNTPAVGSVPQSWLTRLRTVSFSSTTTSAVAATSDLDGVAPVSHACTHNGRAHVVVERVETYATSGIMIRAGINYTSGEVFAHAVARVCHGRLAVFSPGFDTNLQSSFVASDTIYNVLPCDYSPDAMVSGNRMAQSLALTRVDIGKPPTSARKDGVATVAAGFCFDIDGARPQQSQTQFPPVVTLATRAAGTLNGVFQVVAVYTWIDAAGNEHRSEPSAVSTSGTLVNEFLDVYVSRMVMPEFSESAGLGVPTYSIDVYVSAAGGTVHYLANTAGGLKMTAYTAVAGHRLFSGVLAGVSGNPQVYTTGAGNEELTSEPPPAFQAICTVGDRMWAIDAEDRSRVWFTKPFAAGYATEWNTVNTLFLGDNGVGISDVGGVPTVFCERGIWQVYGEGPSALGVGSFAPARRLPHEVACLDATSVCKTPAGVVFRSRGGVMLLDNGLALQDIGKPISSLYVSGTPTGYCKIAYDELMSELHVIDFDAAHYVFNMGEGKWSKWTQDSAFQYWADCVCVAGRMWFLQRGASVTDSICRAKAIDEADHNKHVYGWSMQTPWIRFDGVLGNMRVWEVIPQIRLGSAVADTGTLSVLYETRDSSTDTFTWSAANIIALGSAGQTVNLRCRTTHQRTKQFRITLTEGTPGAATAGHVPVGMRVLYGIQPGAERKTSTTQNKGGT